MEYNYNNEQPPKTSFVTKLVIFITFLFLVAALFAWNFYATQIAKINNQTANQITQEDVDKLLAEEPAPNSEKAMSEEELSYILNMELVHSTNTGQRLSPAEMQKIKDAN
ncbi:MAG: hypothetical protein QG568_279 [Patescibacteria group bacterium]|nr:hypothetical protein [Patescibacteria group bacterium]